MITKQQTTLNMATFLQAQSLLLLETLNELDLDTEADLCEKLHGDAEQLIALWLFGWMIFRRIYNGSCIY